MPEKNVHGLQGAGLVNIAKGDVTGVQASGLLNYTGGKVVGTQLGIIKCL